MAETLTAQIEKLRTIADQLDRNKSVVTYTNHRDASGELRAIADTLQALQPSTDHEAGRALLRQWQAEDAAPDPLRAQIQQLVETWQAFARLNRPMMSEESAVRCQTAAYVFETCAGELAALLTPPRRTRSADL